MEYQFKPFQRVLVRDPIYGKWEADIYSHFDASEAVDNGPHFCVGGCYDEGSCIPYEGNEALLGTTGEPYEYKIGDNVEVADYLLSGVSWREAVVLEYQPTTGYFVVSFSDTGVNRTVPLSQMRPIQGSK